MTAAGNILAGGRIVASVLQQIAPNAAYKGSSQAITNSSTLTNDGALFLSLQANATYVFVCMLAYNGGTQASSDLKFGWTYPSGTTMAYSLAGRTTGGAATTAFWENQTAVPVIGTNGTGTNYTALLVGTIVTGGTPGILQFQWAQNTSNATATTVLAGSVLAAWQIA